MNAPLRFLPVFGLFLANPAAAAPVEDRLADDDSWFEDAAPCADSTAVGRLFGDARDARDHEEGRFGADDAAEGASAVDGCDPDEALLFRRDAAPDPSPPAIHPATRPRHRAALSLDRAPDGGTRSVLRGRATRDGWAHRLEIREGVTTRWQVERAARAGADDGDGDAVWRVLIGDLHDTAWRAAPRGLPRRTLPRGWKAVTGTPDAPRPYAPTRLQGIAAGGRRDGWTVYSLHARNNVTSGKEPPWREAWSLRHDAAGVSATRGIPLTLHASHTRVARGAADSLSESLVAAALALPDADLVLARGVFAGNGRARSAGWMAGGEVRRVLPERFGGGEVELTARQRGAGWTSAWDPAVGAPPGDGKEPDAGSWGAGEVRLAAVLPRRDVGDGTATLRGDVRRIWNLAAGTRRHGARGRFSWRVGDWRADFTGTLRGARAASGSVSRYRALEIETRIATFPGWRARAWRTWNHVGPRRTGLFLGAEPAWGRRNAWRGRAGLRLETRAGADGATDARVATAELGLRARPGGSWIVDAVMTVPHGDGETGRWRITLTTAR